MSFRSLCGGHSLPVICCGWGLAFILHFFVFLSLPSFPLSLVHSSSLFISPHLFIYFSSSSSLTLPLFSVIFFLFPLSLSSVFLLPLPFYFGVRHVSPTPPTKQHSIGPPPSMLLLIITFDAIITLSEPITFLCIFKNCRIITVPFL